jgi:hypothetical protein
VPYSMEGSRRLWLSLFYGDHTCLEEGAHLAGRSYTWRISDLFVSVER